MKKYYELLLMLACCGSVIILLIYKSENKRLKYVLQAVNFFGRKDSSVVMRLENMTKHESALYFEYPMPAWLVMGDAFHVYSAFWSQHQLRAGSEALAIVVGKREAIINHKCSMHFDDGQDVNGIFKFQRAENDPLAAKDPFIMYTFICKLTQDFGVPQSVAFSQGAGQQAAPSVPLRRMKVDWKANQNFSKDAMTVCVDMRAYNNSSSYAGNANLLQFFLYHQLIGISSFYIYNGNALPLPLRQILHKANLNIYYLPFNFPFNDGKASESTRRAVESDCVMRNTGVAKYTTLLKVNEFLYPKARLDAGDSIVRLLDQYDQDITKFELPSFAVCLDSRNKILLENKFYDPEVKTLNKLFIYRPRAVASTYSLFDAVNGGRPTKERTFALPLSKAFTHHYVECTHVGKDGVRDWQTHIRDDFMHYIESLRTELAFLI